MADDPKVFEQLEKTVKLDNGDEGFVITMDTSTNPKGRYFCHVCNAVLCTPQSVLQHASGKNHIKKMSADFFPHEKFTKLVIKEKKAFSAAATDAGIVVTAPGVEMVDLAPGEPVPPGFEELVSRVPEITARLDQMKTPMIGLEFLAEVTPTEMEVEPRYVCLLCDKRGDGRTVLSHLISFNHRFRYISRYFPRTHEVFLCIPKLAEYRRGTGEVLAKIVKAIETKFGRLPPVIVDGAVFEDTKNELFKEILEGKHFHETPDSCYETMVDMSFIKKVASDTGMKLITDDEKDEVKVFSASDKFLSKFTKKSWNEVEGDEEVKKFPTREEERGDKNPITIPDANRRPLKRPRQRSVSPISSNTSSSRSRSRSPRHRNRRRSRSRSRGRRYEPRRPKVPFRRTLSRSRSRSRSPRRRGNSPRAYPRVRSPTYSRRTPPSRHSPYRRPPPAKTWAPVRPVSFKMKTNAPIRQEDLEEKEARERKNKLRKQVKNYIDALNDELAQKLKSHEKFPEKHPLYSEEWKKFWNRRYKELTVEGKDASKHDFKPEWIKFWGVRVKDLLETEKKERIKSFCKDLGAPELAAVNFEEPEGEDDIIEITPPPAKANGSKNDDIEDDEEPDDSNIISVLRLLTALESQLGSLGPRVVALLAQALAMDKVGRNRAVALLDLKENVVLFDTVKEKLKGQLFAKIVEKHMITATKRTITAIAALLSTHEQKKKEQQFKFAQETPTVAPLIVPGVGAVDKMAIAQQIATALIAQGKTDVSEEALEELINAVVGMAQEKQLAKASHKSEEKGKSNLQTLLSSVVNSRSTASAIEQSSSLQLLQSYAESEPTIPLSLKDMSDLTENDLKTLLQNFKDLSREEQQFLIAYLKEIEAKDPSGVERLRKFIDYGSDPVDATKVAPAPRPRQEPSGRLSPFASRVGGANPANTHHNSFDDDDDVDYTFEDIAKAARKNVKEAKKKISNREVAAQMIKDQQKKTADAKKAVSPATVRGVPIDPNDLLSLVPTTKASPVPIVQPAPPVESPSTIAVTVPTTVEAPPPVDSVPIVEIADENTAGEWEGYPQYNYQEAPAYDYGAADSTDAYAAYPPPTWPTEAYSAPPPNEHYQIEAPYNYPPPIFEAQSVPTYEPQVQPSYEATQYHYY